MRINLDLKEMQPEGWIFWQAVESEQAQVRVNKNWGLIHADFENGTEKYYMTKKYYAFAQYTKFIRPGDTMIDINDLDAVAFINEEKGKLIIVQRNVTTNTISYTYDLNRFTITGSTAAIYRTSASENFKQLPDISLSGNQLNASARAQSITTYIISALATPTTQYIGNPVIL